MFIGERNQEHFVGFYRNAVPPLEWMAGTREVAASLGGQIGIVPDEKIRIHMITTHELDRLDVQTYDDALNVEKSVLDNVQPSFYDEMTVVFGALTISRIGYTKKRELIVPVLPNPDLSAERSSALRSMPWRLGEDMPDPDDFVFRIRLGTVISPTLNGDTVVKRIGRTIPDEATFQPGKIKTLE